MASRLRSSFFLICTLEFGSPEVEPHPYTLYDVRFTSFDRLSDITGNINETSSCVRTLSGENTFGLIHFVERENDWVGD